MDLEAVASFLEGKGSIRMIMLLEEENRLHRQEIIEETGLAGGTVDTRITEARDAGLIDRQYQERSAYHTPSFALTTDGVKLRQLMADRGIERTFVRYRAYEMELEKRVRDLQEFLQEQSAPFESADIDEASEEHNITPYTREKINTIAKVLTFPSVDQILDDE